MHIVLEGLNFSGKSTIAYELSKELENSYVTCQPSTDTSNGDMIRHLLLHNDNLTDKSERYLFLADRWQHIEEIIEPKLKTHDYVICDRSELSSLVFQGSMKDNLIQLLDLHDDILKNHQPDITFFIDVEPQEIINRQTDKLDRIDTDNIGIIELRRGFYFSVMQVLTDDYNQRFYVIDGNRDVELIISDIIDFLESNRNRLLDGD